MRVLVVIFWLLLIHAVYGGGSVSENGGRKIAGIPAGPLTISNEGYQLILKHEVGGGAVYYSRYLQKPTWPGGASGVTIGIGYDLGYNTKAQIASDWNELSEDVVNRLQSVAGVRGSAAKYKLSPLRGIVIPWEIAQRVYQKKTIPRFGAITESAYKGTSTMNPHIQGAMLSWTFNRGGGISSTSDRDREKRALRGDIPLHPTRLPAHFRDSKRLWRGKGLDGLIRRREDEALLIESSFQ